MYRFSQMFIFCPFLHGCISLSVLSAVPYSCSGYVHSVLGTVLAGFDQDLGHLQECF
jgi:hypothetical protein